MSMLCDAFEYDEEKAVTVKQFYKLYRDQIPLLGIITLGYYGDTPFDCYESYQIFHVHGVSSQPRVVARDSIETRQQRHRYLSIPVDTKMLFRVIKGHTTGAVLLAKSDSDVLQFGEAESLKSILAQHQLPVLVKMACDRSYRVKVGQDWKTAGDLGNLLIMKYFEEKFMMIHCLFEKNLHKNPWINLMAITPELNATIITGLKGKSKEEYDLYLQKLAEDTKEDMNIPRKQKYYDKTRGNPDWAVCYLETISLATGSGGETSEYAPLVPFEEVFPNTGPPPPVPPRQNSKSSVEEGSLTEDPYYEEIDPKCFEDTFKQSNNSSDGTGKDGMHTAKKNKHKGKLFKQKSTDKNEKEYKHLEKSIKIRKEQQKLTDNAKGKKDSALSNAPDTTKAKTNKISATTEISNITSSTDIGKYEPLREGDNDEHASASGRYVSLAAADLQSGYLRVVHKNDETPNRLDDGNTTAALPDGDTSLPNKCNVKSYPNNLTREDVSKLTIDQLAKYLKSLKLEKHVPAFKESMIDGCLLQELSADDLAEEFKLTRLEAIKLVKFASSGHIPQ